MVFAQPNLFRDAALAFLILIAGLVVAAAMATPFRHLTELAYPVALCFALSPFWWFTRWCRIHDFDSYDYAALSLFYLLVSVLRLVLPAPNQQMIEILFIAVAFAAFLGGWSWIRLKHRSHDCGTTTNSR